MNANWVAFEKIIRPHLNDLKNFHFSYANPLFWFFFFLLFLILSIKWRPKKSLSFCFLLVVILLIDTRIEGFIGSISNPGDGVDPAVIVRVVVGILAAFIGIYYILIRED